MSGFLSPKYLKYRDEKAAGKIEGDRPCPGCGYNLRGLNYGRACPECAAPIEREETVEEVLLAGGSRVRGMLRTGLALAAACLFAVTAARVVFFLLGAQGTSTAQDTGYLALGLAIAVAWTVAAWLVTPREIESAGRPMRSLRWAIRASQPLWIVAYVMWLVGVVQSGDSLVGVARGLRVVAGIGAVVLAFVLGRLAVESEKEVAARRLNAVVWLLGPVTLMPQVFRGSITWFEFVLLGLLLAPWVWLMVLFGLAVLELQRHVVWTTVHARERHTRSARMAETRRAMDEQIKAQIRPLPPDAPDIPLERPEEDGDP